MLWVSLPFLIRPAQALDWAGFGTKMAPKQSHLPPVITGVRTKRHPRSNNVNTPGKPNRKLQTTDTSEPLISFTRVIGIPPSLKSFTGWGPSRWN
jgi:hypothetical protein